jgi:DNA-binding NtrC family response regulator
MISTAPRSIQLFLDPKFERDQILDHFQRLGIPMVTQDPSMLHILDKVRRLGRSKIPVSILGETGVGKELIARALHTSGRGPSRPFVAVNSAEISDTLGTSLLFGHRKGSFTDAREDRPGLVEEATGGTLFIDEVADLQSDVQSQLLRFLDDQRYRAIGESRERQADVRIVSATNKPLETLVAEGGFRLDLFHRLSGAVLRVPPLRERPADIALIARFHADRLGITVPDALLERWTKGYWEGNVRQLVTSVQTLRWNPRSPEVWEVREYSLEPSSGNRGNAPIPEISGHISVSLRDTVRNFEKGIIQSALQHCRGNVARAARCLSVSRTTLISKMNRLGLNNRARHTRSPAPPRET